MIRIRKIVILALSSMLLFCTGCIGLGSEMFGQLFSGFPGLLSNVQGGLGWGGAAKQWLFTAFLNTLIPWI